MSTKLQKSINRTINEAIEKSIKDNDQRQAIIKLGTAIKKTNQAITVLERQAVVANRLIAENMFAIVRLEIAQATDQIVNVSLHVKRDVTGSGKAELAMTVTATLVMLAGNVLSGGGMSLLGGLIVASGEAMKAAAKNDAAGMVTATAGTAMTASAVHEGDREQFTMSDEGEVESRSQGDTIRDIISNSLETILELTELAESEDETEKQYEVIRRKTAWIPHGAGGTNAITNDVQEAIAQAYGQVLRQITIELKSIGHRRELSGVGIIGNIVSKPQDKSGDIHPVTKAVLTQALENLAGNGGDRYQALTGGSGWRGSSSKLNEAKRLVKRGYAEMASEVRGGEGISNGKSLLAKLKS